MTRARKQTKPNSPQSYLPTLQVQLTSVAAAALLSSCAWLGTASPHKGAPPPQIRPDFEQDRRQLETLQRAVAEHERQLEADRRTLQVQKRALEQLSHKLGLTAAVIDSYGQEQEAVPTSTLRALAARGQADAGPQILAQADPTPPVGQVAAQTQTVGQAPQRTDTKPPEVAPIFQQPGVLTPKGKFVLEPSLQYAYSTSNRVSAIGFEIFPALLIGVLDIRTANRSAYTTTLTGRYGVSNRLELEARVPYVYRRETLVSREFLEASFVDSEFSASGQGLGDIELTGRYQFNDGGMDKPYYVGTLRFKSRTGKDPFEVERDPVLPRGSGRFRELPTGTGFLAAQPGVTVIYPTDPAVFFGSLNYLWNLPRTGLSDRAGQEFGKVDPGDAVTFNIGMGLALNERASFSIGYDHSIFGKTKQNGQTPAGELTTQLGTLLFGYAYRLKPNRSLNLSFGIGVTKDAPDVQITLRLPITF